MREAGRGVSLGGEDPLQQVLYAIGLGLLLGLLLAGSWTLVWVAGGTHTALPHVFYLPIVLAALPFGFRGAVGVAVIATVACGPLMPLDVETMQLQQPANWLTRGAFFTATGVVAGSLTLSMRHRFERQLAGWFGRELDVAVPDDDVAVSATRLKQVLADRAFHCVFQPVYALDDGRLLAVEALTRFDAEPPLPPNVWFDQAAREGLGVEFEVATLSAAVHAARDCPDDVALSVNVSPQLLADHRLEGLLDRAGSRPLIVEVTEHAAVDDYLALQETRLRLRERGVRLAVDDTGAGFASLRHIVRLAPDYIKVDMSLTQELQRDPIRRGLARALADFAARTGVMLVIEGIERADDLAVWQSLGAHAGQGYLLARPGPLPAAASCAAIRDGASGSESLFDLASLRN